MHTLQTGIGGELPQQTKNLAVSNINCESSCYIIIVKLFFERVRTDIPLLNKKVKQFYLSSTKKVFTAYAEKNILAA